MEHVELLREPGTSYAAGDLKVEDACQPEVGRREQNRRRRRLQDLQVRLLWIDSTTTGLNPV